MPKTITKPITVTTTIESYVALGGVIFLVTLLALITIVITRVMRR